MKDETVNAIGIAFIAIVALTMIGAIILAEIDARERRAKRLEVLQMARAACTQIGGDGLVPHGFVGWNDGELWRCMRYNPQFFGKERLAIIKAVPKGDGTYSIETRDK